MKCSHSLILHFLRKYSNGLPTQEYQYGLPCLFVTFNFQIFDKKGITLKKYTVKARMFKNAQKGLHGEPPVQTCNSAYTQTPPDFWYGKRCGQYLLLPKIKGAGCP